MSSQQEVTRFIHRVAPVYRRWLETTRVINLKFLEAWRLGCADALWNEVRSTVPPTQECWLHYFIRIRGTGDIKIGKTNRIEGRYRDIDSGVPRGSFLLALYPSDAGHETELKNDFARYRLNGEWFEAGPHLLSYLGLLGSNVEDFDLDAHYRRVQRPRYQRRPQ